MINKKAFTLIELLIVIVIIGILAGILISSMVSATNNANDARRKADINQLVKAIQMIKISTTLDNQAECDLGSNCTSIQNQFASQGITSIPKDPNGNYYKYTASSSTNEFTVKATLSTNSSYSYISSNSSYLLSYLPKASCKEIFNSGASTGDGIYYIDPNGGDTADKFQVYCDMTTDGGGWTLVWKSNTNPAVNTSAINASALTSKTMDTIAKFSDIVINQIKSSTAVEDTGYRIEQDVCSPVIVGYISSACVFSFQSGASISNPSANCRKGKKRYTDVGWLSDTYPSEPTWCSNEPWSSSIMCLNDGTNFVGIHYRPAYATNCSHSYTGVRVWVK